MGTKRGVLVHGAGWVSTQHIEAFRRNPHTEIVAISSRRLESARTRAAAAGLDVPCFDSLEKALATPGIDIVSICTPQHVHAENVLLAAAAGKHLVIEKPVANSMAELRAMRQAVRQAGVKTVVSFVLRWNPLFRMLKRLIAEGALGRLYAVETDYQSNIAGWWSGFDDARRLETGVSAMLVGGCHALDAARWFAGPSCEEAARVEEVFAYRGGWRKGADREYNYTERTWATGKPPLEYDGYEVYLLRFAGGIVGKVSVNLDCIMPYTLPIEIFGDRGTVKDNRLWSHTFAGQTDWIEIPTILPDSSDVSHHPFQAQMDHFVECLDTGRESHCNLEDAYHTHEVVFAAQECYRSGRPVRLPLPEPG